MADVFGIGTLIGSAISSGLNYASQQETNQTNKRIAKQNLEFQREQLDYQKALQQQIFAREDTAHQREINDLRQAGINPLATANGGTGANAGAVVNTEALHNDYNQQPVQLDPSAFLQAAAQMEAARNNRATEKLEQTKIESNETLQMMQIEEDRYNQEQERLIKSREIAEKTRNNKEMEKIDAAMEENQREYNRIMRKHLSNTDDLNKAQQALIEERFKKIDIPESKSRLILSQLQQSEYREKIDNIIADTELLNANEDQIRQEMKYRLSEEIRKWFETTEKAAADIADVIISVKSLGIAGRNADTQQYNAQTYRNNSNNAMRRSNAGKNRGKYRN